MKILLLQETDWIDRYPHTQHHLTEKLSIRGHHIKVIDYEFDWKKKNPKSIYRNRIYFHNFKKIYQGSHIDVIRPTAINIPILNYFFLIFWHYKEIIIQIKQFQPDIIIGFGILTAYFGSILAKRYNLPFIYYWIDALDTLIPEKVFQNFGRLVEGRTIQNSNCLIVTNEKLKDHIIALGAERNSIEIISSGINFSRFNLFIDGSKIRTQYGIQDSDVVLFFMGWIYHFSGLKEIACLLGEAKNKYSQVKLLIVGEGDAYEDLKDIKKKYSLNEQLIITGKQPYDAIPEFIAASDYCILPAYPNEKVMQDIVPIKILEYMALGKPVIATKLPGLLKEFGTNSGILFVDTPEDTLSCAMNPINYEKKKELGARANDCVKIYDWDVIIERFEKKLMNIRTHSDD